MEGARVAVDDDLPRLAELVRLGTAEVAEQKGGAVWRAHEARGEPIEAGLADALRDPDACVMAGTIDGSVLGYGVAHIERLQDGSVLGVVDDIFVEEGARGIGVGEAMMAELVGWCSERECIGIDAMALPGQRLTKNFFEELGFTARKLVMHHRLRPLDDHGDGGPERPLQSGDAK